MSARWVPVGLALALGWSSGFGAGLLGQQPPPRQEVDDRIAEAITQAEDLLRRQAELEADWRRLAEKQAVRLANRLEEIVALEAELRGAVGEAEVAERVLDRASALLRKQLMEVEGTLEQSARLDQLARVAARSQATVDRPGTYLTTEADRDTQPDLALDAEIVRLEELWGRVDSGTGNLRALRVELRRESIRRQARVVERLLKLREVALAALPPGIRARMVSLADRGADEVKLELDLLHKIILVDSLRLRELLLASRQSLRDFFTALTAGKVLLRVVIVLVLWRWFHRRSPEFLRGLRRRVAAEVGPRGYRRAAPLIRIGEASAPWAIFLLGLGSLSWALGPAILGWRLMGLPFLLLAIYGGYRLGVDLLVALIVTGARQSGAEMSPQRRAKVEKSVRWPLRVLALAAVLPLIIEFRIGPGFLYLLSRRGFVWVLALSALGVAVAWRRDIADAYLAAAGHGHWADLVRGTRDRWTGVLVLPLLLPWLFGRALIRVAKNFAVVVDALRRGSNLLFRRRIEKQAERRGYAEGDLERLPPAVVGALDETVRAEDWEAVEEIPGLDRAAQAVAGWRSGKGPGLFLVAGEAGIGRAAWVDRFLLLEPEARRLKLEQRIVDPVELRKWLWDAIVPEGGQDHLGAALGGGDRLVVVLENAENLFLASLGGYQCLEELDRLAHESRFRVFWLVSIERLAWKHLWALGRARVLSRLSVELTAWEPRHLKRLLRGRLSGAGLEVSFRELLQRGTGGDRGLLQREGERAFVNLLWEFSGGNPHVALHYFLRSLVPTREGGLEVRLFRQPPVDELVDLGDEALFLLAALARHRGLTPAETIAATSCPAGLVQMLMVRLSELGVISEEAGRWRVGTHWQASVLRLLRRRNILYS